jgi:hypothetical protein
MEFVVAVLVGIFRLSMQDSERVMLEAHHTGAAHVVTLPLEEAEARVEKAHALARAARYPLTFTYEQRPLTSMPRFMAVVFPAWWGFAIAAERRRPPETAFLVTFAAGFSLFAYLFINWQPVF